MTLGREGPYIIKGIFKRNDASQIVSFTSTGHADTGPYESDIVCTGVSMLAASTVNGIASLTGFESIVEMDEEESGYLYTEVTSGMTREQNNITEVLLENLLSGLQSIEAENLEYIQTKAVNDKQEAQTMLLSINLQLFAHKKGGGSTPNGRDSESKRLGAKRTDGRTITGELILYRQRGTKIYPGVSVGISGDSILFAKVDGVVCFERRGRSKKQVSTYPVAQEA